MRFFAEFSPLREFRGQPAQNDRRRVVTFAVLPNYYSDTASKMDWFLFIAVLRMTILKSGAPTQQDLNLVVRKVKLREQISDATYWQT